MRLILAPLLVFATLPLTAPADAHWCISLVDSDNPCDLLGCEGAFHVHLDRTGPTCISTGPIFPICVRTWCVEIGVLPPDLP